MIYFACVSHKSIRQLIEDTAKKLGDDIQFDYGRKSDVNVIRDKRYPFIALDPLSAVPQFTVDGIYNYTKLWNVTMAFYALDDAASDGNEYKFLLDDIDKMVDHFVNQLNFYADQANEILLSNISQEPFIKVGADILTGWILTLQILAPNDFDYCEIACEDNTREC